MESTKADKYAPLWYPLVITTALTLHLVMLNVGIDITYSTYIPVLFSAASITLLEIYFPYRRQWHPEKGEVINDSIYMIMVQVILPQFLAFLVAILLVRQSSLTVWPHSLPIAVQVILMVLLADFLRYWLHVASHNLMPLWQLHAVHHSPQKLYWLNVGRFHPIEKAIQFLFDAMPFIILGVSEEVLALYFVFYAANGYFQHSNVHLKMGILNYIISSAELHRWHHSIRKFESNRNYGNNIIIWDLLFGTYFLPRKRQVKNLGLKNRYYPLSFMEQAKAPFIFKLESINLPLVSYRDILINILLRIRLEFLYLTKRAYVLQATRNPRRYQLRTLEKILKQNEESAFGRDHNFGSIKDYSDFRKNSPICTYEDLIPYIDLDDLNGYGLTVEKPVLYQVTSGTSGKSKYIPVTPTGMKHIDSQQNLVTLARYMDNPGTFSGKIFAVVSPAIEGYTRSGVPFGSASGLIYQKMPTMSRSKYVVPYDVFNIDQYDLKYLLLALFALSDPRVTIVATANPSTMIRILDEINSNADLLLKILETGDLHLTNISEPVLGKVSAHFHAKPNRARKLRKVYKDKRILDYVDIWPNLQALVTWTGGSCGIPLKALKGYIPEATRVIELGYLASEMRGTITIQDQLGIPTFLSNFFEFIPVDDWEMGRHNVKLLDELSPGQKYYVVVTTFNGLYRYFMNDILEVTEYINLTPTLRFLQKGSGVTSITGEKLYENQVLEAIGRLQESCNVRVIFHLWLADETESRYKVYIELDGEEVDRENQFVDALEAALCEINMEYKQKRQSGRLKRLALIFLKTGTADEFKKFKINQGQREGQYKPLCLLYKKDSTFPFDEYEST
jgi:sterol desaturase/sphingolipid hydroxylase (fatty acid hydroxylase superfamily)